MANLRILTAPDPVLRTVSKPVKKVDDALRAFIDDMLEIMYASMNGIGLAAIQVGVRKRIIVMDLSEEDAPKNPKCYINPEITWTGEELAIHSEGCLSVPDYYAEVERPAKCRVKYLDYYGKEHEQEAEGLFATCIQHEIDHLNGVLFFDHISSLRRGMIMKKLNKAQREKAQAHTI
jgi:peptide deformylase